MAAELRLAFAAVPLKESSSILEKCWQQNDSSNFSELAEGRTWLEFPYEKIRMVDFMSALSDEGVVALMPAMIIGSLYTDEADVFLMSFPSFLEDLYKSGRIYLLTERQLACLCRLFDKINSLDADSRERLFYEDYIDLHDRFYAKVCNGLGRFEHDQGL